DSETGELFDNVVMKRASGNNFPVTNTKDIRHGTDDGSRLASGAAGHQALRQLSSGDAHEKPPHFLADGVRVSEGERRHVRNDPLPATCAGADEDQVLAD